MKRAIFLSLIVPLLIPLASCDYLGKKVAEKTFEAAIQNSMKEAREEAEKHYVDENPAYTPGSEIFDNLKYQFKLSSGATGIANHLNISSSCLDDANQLAKKQGNDAKNTIVELNSCGATSSFYVSDKYENGRHYRLITNQDPKTYYITDEDDLYISKLNDHLDTVYEAIGKFSSGKAPDSMPPFSETEYINFKFHQPEKLKELENLTISDALALIVQQFKPTRNEEITLSGITKINDVNVYDFLMKRKDTHLFIGENRKFYSLYMEPEFVNTFDNNIQEPTTNKKSYSFGSVETITYHFENYQFIYNSPKLKTTGNIIPLIAAEALWQKVLSQLKTNEQANNILLEYDNQYNEKKFSLTTSMPCHKYDVRFVGVTEIEGIEALAFSIDSALLYAVTQDNKIYKYTPHFKEDGVLPETAEPLQTLSSWLEEAKAEFEQSPSHFLEFPKNYYGSGEDVEEFLIVNYSTELVKVNSNISDKLPEATVQIIKSGSYNGKIDKTDLLAMPTEHVTLNDEPGTKFVVAQGMTDKFPSLKKYYRIRFYGGISDSGIVYLYDKNELKKIGSVKIDE